MSQFVFQHLVNNLGLADQFYIDSRATSTEEIGNPPHRGTIRKMQEEGIPVIQHKAKQISWGDYNNFDYIIGMDTWNIKDLKRILKGDPDRKVYKFLIFAGAERDIADPWYTGDFNTTYDDVVKGCNGLLGHLKKQGEI